MLGLDPSTGKRIARSEVCAHCRCTRRTSLNITKLKFCVLCASHGRLDPPERVALRFFPFLALN